MQTDQRIVINEEKKEEKNEFRFDPRDNCVFYLNDQCRYSDSYCRKKHDPVERTRYQAQEKRPCFFHYHHPDGCKFGSKCFNSHTHQWVPKELANQLKKNTEIAEQKLKEERELTKKLQAKIKELEQIKTNQSTLFHLSSEFRTFLVDTYADIPNFTWFLTTLETHGEMFLSEKQKIQDKEQEQQKTAERQREAATK
mmetsp:Transcript_17101/g.22595  ORF Transcript_17101/g.22595 Transcript_17101/m.22595 type:complete len:197 (-) Transcript_17101:1376-1966(-)